MDLDLFDGHQKPWLVFQPWDAWEILYLRAFQLFHPLHQSFSGRVRVPHREGAADDSEIVLVPSQSFEVHHVDVFHLVNFQEIYDLLDRGDFAILEAILLICFVIIVHLGPVTPKEVLLRAFNKPSWVVPELSLLLFVPPTLDKFVPIQYIVFLIVTQFLIN